MGGNTRVSPWQPPPGHDLYLPDLYYFTESAEALFQSTLRITARCVVQWADRYAAVCPDQAPWSGQVVKGGHIEGDFPLDLAQKEKALRSVFQWARGRGCFRPELSLSKGGRYLLYFDGGLHFNLILTPSQFRSLEDCWEEHGFPRDLYFLSSQRRPTREEAGRSGAGLASLGRFTPKQWAKKEEMRKETERLAERLGARDVYEDEVRSLAWDLDRAAAQLKDQLDLEKSKRPDDSELRSELDVLRNELDRSLRMLSSGGEQSGSDDDKEESK